MKVSAIFLLLLLISSVNFLSAQCINGNCTTGWGTYKWESGDKYTGEWKSGERTGLGVYDWKSGAFYYGYFEDGKLEGQGFYIGLDSTEDQIGLFHNSTLSEKQSFGTEGCLLGNCTDGDGVYLWTTNDLYIGEWHNGARTGYGRYDWDNGSWYVGNFTDGKLDGEGEYHPETGDVMKGTFSNGAFQGSSVAGDISATSNSTAIDYSTDSYPDRKINEDNICSVLQNVIADYTNDFENIKGTKEEEDEYSFGDVWHATWKLNNSTESKISAPILSGHNTWYNVLYESASYNDTKAKYDDYVSLVKSCGSNCCTLVYDTHDFKGDSYESHTTFWLPLSVKDGYSDDFKNMKIEVEFSKQIVGDGWEVIARVTDKSR